MAFSNNASSKHMVAGWMSTKIIFAPLRAKALAEETNVKEGTTTSSPSFTSIAKAANSNAEVQLAVNLTVSQPVIFDNSNSHFLENSPG